MESVFSEWQEFNGVRMIAIDGIPYFVGREVCETFGDTNYRRTLRRLDSEYKRLYPVPTKGGTQKMILVSEQGLYSLLFLWCPHIIVRSSRDKVRAQQRVEMVKRFQNWICRDVLPAIRKHGFYVAGMKRGEFDYSNPVHLKFMLRNLQHITPKEILTMADSILTKRAEYSTKELLGSTENETA